MIQYHDIQVPAYFLSQTDGVERANLLDISTSEWSQIFFVNDASRIEQHIIQSATDADEIEKIFNGLVKKWQDETGSFSLTARRYSNAAYQSIILLAGRDKEKIISLILNELKQRPDRWFAALKLLTNENPAADSKSFEETVKLWLEWGTAEGYPK